MKAGNCSNARSPSAGAAPTPSRQRSPISISKCRNWEDIELLYQRLQHIPNSPVVAMNRAIAVAELEGPQAALDTLDRLEPRLPVLPLDTRRLAPTRRP